MIITLVINLGYQLLNFIIQRFPDSTGFPADAHSAMSSLGGYLGMWSPVLPITTLITCLTLVFSVEISIFGFKTTKWVISHIPQIGGKGN